MLHSRQPRPAFNDDDGEGGADKGRGEVEWSFGGEREMTVLRKPKKG